MLTEKRRCSSGEKYRNGVLIIWRAGRPLGWALPCILVVVVVVVVVVVDFVSSKKYTETRVIVV